MASLPAVSNRRWPRRVMNEIDAVVRRIGKPMLWADDLSGITEKWRKIASCFQSRRTHQRIRPHLFQLGVSVMPDISTMKKTFQPQATPATIRRDTA
jgi:hypothetical protein